MIRQDRNNKSKIENPKKYNVHQTTEIISLLKQTVAYFVFLGEKLVSVGLVFQTSNERAQEIICQQKMGNSATILQEEEGNDSLFQNVFAEIHRNYDEDVDENIV